MFVAFLLGLASCGEPELRGRAAFDEAMARIQAANQRPPAVQPVVTGSVTLPAATPPRRPAVTEPGMQARGPLRSTGPAGAAQAGGGSVTLNFVEAQVAQVVQTVLGDLLRVNYTIDPRVTGTITLQTQRPVPEEAALSLLESALAANGAALLRGDHGYRVAPLDGALQSAPPLARRAAGGQPGPGFSIVALPLVHARAADMQRVLQPLVPPGGFISADEARNILLLAGTGPQLNTLLETVESFDVGWIRSQSVALLPLDSAPAATVAQEISSIFAGAEGSAREGLRVVPVARMNAVLVVASQPQQLERVRRWVRNLDAAGMGSAPQLFVYNVQYVRAAELAGTLRQLLQGGGGRTDPASLLAPGQQGVQMTGGTVAPISDMPLGGAGSPATQASLAGGNGQGAANPLLASGRGSPATPASIPGMPAPFGAPGPADERSGLPAAAVRIVADEAQNALIVYASQADWRLVERAVLLLDRPPNQVAVDAIIAEVTLNQELEYGLSWFFRSGRFQFNLATTAAQTVPGFNLLYSGGADATVVLQALAGLTDVRVISSPQVMVLSNQTARLRVGDSVPIVTQQATGGGVTDTRIVNSVSLRDTGVSLDVTPRVNSVGGVLLDVDQDISDAVATTTSGIDSPTIQQRRLRTVVSVASGETVVLGGLIREADSNTRTGLPFLVNIPVLRELTGVRGTSRRRTELLVLITPRVVQNVEDQRRVTEELRLRMQSMAPRDEPRRTNYHALPLR
ncbi:type II secretion system secretin GspD [Roseomonas sp. SSH11]|uniref:Type II secretion system secretin GspD n=1 Tax=Pararoseomonas baculiformis TaxID=2820812 RepID=A0ABS4AC31_9PROT|nr:type II secretion system secretin GspD [Pararoseomonas baculiformis]MBP0444559.1 type II secretion system secretin GspD [Pararoseomonas baculiformis]